MVAGQVCPGSDTLRSEPPCPAPHSSPPLLWHLPGATRASFLTVPSWRAPPSGLAMDDHVNGLRPMLRTITEGLQPTLRAPPATSHHGPWSPRQEQRRPTLCDPTTGAAALPAGSLPQLTTLLQRAAPQAAGYTHTPRGAVVVAGHGVLGWHPHCAAAAAGAGQAAQRGARVSLTLPLRRWPTLPHDTARTCPYAPCTRQAMLQLGTTVSTLLASGLTLVAVHSQHYGPLTHG